MIHSSANVVATAFQMSIFIPPSEVQEVWWTPILPPALIAVTVSMTIFPLSTGLLVALDPFCPLEDIDIEFMDRKPNFWALIPTLLRAVNVQREDSGGLRYVSPENHRCRCRGYE